MVLLVTSDNEQFTTERDIVERSVLIKNMLEGRYLWCSESYVNLTFCIHRCWWIWSTNSPSQCLFQRAEESVSLFSSPISKTITDAPRKVLEYCEHHRGEPLPTADSEASQDETRKRTTDISEWDQKFITVDQEMLFEIILAANYLDIKSLLYDNTTTLYSWILLTELFTAMWAARP